MQDGDAMKAAHDALTAFRAQGHTSPDRYMFGILDPLKGERIDNYTEAKNKHTKTMQIYKHTKQYNHPKTT